MRRPRAIGIATAVMCALAGGAVWCLLSLYSRSELPAFSFVVALPVVWALRMHGYAGRWTGAAIAAACVAIASVYAFCLQAVAQVASLLGLSMRATLHRIDPAMAIDIAGRNLAGRNALVTAGAVALAFALMLRRAKPATS